MSTKPRYASVDPEDAAEASGLFDNVNARITNIQYTTTGPENYQVDGNPIFANVDFLLDGDGDEDSRKVSQSYSLGAQAGDNFDISDDGYGLIPKTDEATLRKGSKWITFTGSLKTAGVPKPVLAAGDMSKLIGLYGLFKRIADPERNFSEDQRTRPGQKKKFPPSTLCLVKLHAMPGEDNKAASKTTAKSTTSAPASAPAAAADDADIETAAWGYVEAILREKGTVQRGGLTLLVSKAAMDNPNRSAIAKHAQSEAFIEKMAELGMVKYGKSEKGQPVSLVA